MTPLRRGGMCSYCRHRKRRRGSAFCSPACEQKRRKSDRKQNARKREVWHTRKSDRLSRGRPSIYRPKCPVCGAEISITQDCNCP